MLRITRSPTWRATILDLYAVFGVAGIVVRAILLYWLLAKQAFQPTSGPDKIGSEVRLGMTIDNLIDEVTLAMSEELTPEQLQRLNNVLALKLHGHQLVEECTEVAVRENQWERILKLYLATKHLENLDADNQ